MSPVFGKSGQSIHRLEDDGLLKGKGKFIDKRYFYHNLQGNFTNHIFRE